MELTYWHLNDKLGNYPCNFYIFSHNVVPAAVLRVALSNCLLQLNVEKGRLLPTLLFLHFIKNGCVEVVHSVSSLQQEVVPHGLEVFQQPVEAVCDSNHLYADKKLEKFSLVKPQKWRLLVVFFQGLHEVPAALDVPPLDVGVEAGAQGELKCLAGDGLRGTVHDEIPSGETLVEVTLLQVQPEREHRTELLKIFWILWI